jgi:hypothetical protein
VGLVPLAPPDPTLVNVQETIQITHAGTYSLELTDRNFPVAIGGLRATVTSSGVPVVCVPASPACANVGNTFFANPGNYQLNVIGTTHATLQAGLFSVRIVDAANNRVAYAKTHAAGKLVDTATELQLISQNAVVSAMDHGFPVPLSQLHVALLQGANVVALRNVSTTSASATLSATAGNAELYVFAIPVSGTGGAYRVSVRQGAETVLLDVRAVNQDAASSVEAFNYQVNVPSAGTYRVRVHDFAMPGPFGALRFAISQNGELQEMADIASTISVEASAGVLDISIMATAQTGEPIVNGLFGVAVTSQNSSVPLWEKTQGVGGLFISHTVNVTAAGRYQLALADHRFPGPFTALNLFVTRGTVQIGSIYAADARAPAQINIDALPGEYAINLLATANNTDNYGFYGLKLDDITVPTPAAPAPASPNSGVNAAESGGGALDMMWMLLALVWMTRKSSRRGFRGC